MPFHIFHAGGYVDYSEPQKGNMNIESNENKLLPFAVEAKKRKPNNWLRILQAAADRRGLLLPGPLNGSPPSGDEYEETESKRGGHKSADQNPNLLLPPSIWSNKK
jgi:hypothetical protein